MKTLTTILPNREARSRRGNEADGSSQDCAGTRLLTSAATCAKLFLAAAMLTAAVSAKAQYVSGYYRSTTTTYAYPSYSPYTPTYSSSYTYANARYTSFTPGLATYTYSSTTYPSYSSSCYSSPSSYSIYGSSRQIGGTTFHNYSSSDGAYLSGTTTTFGNTTRTALYGSGW